MNKDYTFLAPLRDEVLKCIKCGLCMAGCPTYGITKDETMVARGRLTLIKAVMEGGIDASDKYERYITSCIGCLTCDINCPSNVKIGDIIFAAKAQLAATNGLNIIEWMASRLVVGLRWPLPLILRFFRLPMKIYDWLPVKSPFDSLIPFVRNKVKRRLPGIGNSSFSSQYPEIIKTTSKRPKGRVAFFPGCVIELSTQDIGRATVSILNKLGYDVVIPEGQYCCGSPLQSLGDVATAKKVARKNIDVFSPLDIEAIIVSCATCGHTLKKEYPVLLGDRANGDYNKVRGFSEKIIDIHEFIVSHHGIPNQVRNDNYQVRNNNNQVQANRQRVTFHDPCHLKKGMGVYQHPRDILKSLPQAEFVEMEDADACCGFGGIFSLYYYELAAKIGERKAENIKRSGSRIVATGCPGCKIHIEDSLHRAGYDATVRHTVELLDEVLN